MKPAESYIESAELSLQAAANIYNRQRDRLEDGYTMPHFEQLTIQFHHERATAFATLALAAASVRSKR